MNQKFNFIFTILFFFVLKVSAQGLNGAVIPWITYEAEQMKTNGIILGPQYAPYKVETESSGQKCVKLANDGNYIEFIASANANSAVIRYNLPDAKNGGGLSSSLSMSKNGILVGDYEVSSKYSWVYGKYPFSNTPDSGLARHFYDEIRITGINIKKGDTIRLRRQDKNETKIKYVIIDLVDLENIAPPLDKPTNAISITDNEFTGNVSNNDYTQAFRNCIAAAKQNSKIVWVPAGTFKITGNITLPAGIIVKGAGMWYSQLVGDDSSYLDADKRVRLIGDGDDIHISDFAVIGKLTYRSDKEANDGIVGSFGKNSTISNLWIEHTKVGMWIENSYNLHISGCRMRNTMADGINFCVGMSHSVIENCTARGTGDDCFAIWPTTYAPQKFEPGNNLISHCTAQLPYLANGVAIYGGDSNKVADCSITDISQGAAILISTTFPTESLNKKINNNFSGLTTIDNCDIQNSGGFDHEWDWRAAIEICLDKRSISGLLISHVSIKNSLSNAISIVAKNTDDKKGILTNTTFSHLTIQNYGLGKKGSASLFISPGSQGNLTVEASGVLNINNRAKGFSVIQ